MGGELTRFSATQTKKAFCALKDSGKTRVALHARNSIVNTLVAFQNKQLNTLGLAQKVSRKSTASLPGLGLRKTRTVWGPGRSEDYVPDKCQIDGQISDVRKYVTRQKVGYDARENGRIYV